MQGNGNIEEAKKMLGVGNITTFTNFYTLFFKKLLIESDKYVKDIQVAEEIVQDVFVKIWERSADLNNIQSIKSYLYRSVINQSINYVNRQKSLEYHHQKIVRDFSETETEEIDQENELIVMLFDEIEKLPPKCKEIFKLNRFEKLKYREIALKLNISERTVENHISNALKILREAMLSNKESNFKSSHLNVLKVFFFF
ncbi:RNA polymerase sigma-70 factor [Pedobacter xixiisoli]|uniref:RNA polymerase sigma-70 factor, ECF subfamily n=1 Tax=Pedobacter xixiisoli TaxID=1476464 RepID=A0A286AEW7_9SPHI|nr:RNA polymerase sigma-70 factor [Pedobacter xixiisoli]SOD20453.1 RNA polymerase sigma-70 factor, ECF subfamily [Pedobacter xixiisoli]